MSILPFNNPILSTRRSGKIEDPFIPLSQSILVKDNKVLLSEIPDQFQHVTVSGLGITWTEIYKDLPTENQFLVDYGLGLVYFHASRNNSQLQFYFLGTGCLYFPASRCWTESDGSTVTETLGEIIENGKTAIDAIGGLTVAVNLAQTLESSLNSKISTGNSLHTTLTNDIPLVDPLVSSLTNTISSANSAKSSLDGSISSSTTSKNNLDSSISQGNSLKLSLDSDISAGNTLNTTLLGGIDTGNILNITLLGTISSADTSNTDLIATNVVADTKKSELEDSISNSFTAKSNLDGSITTGNSIKSNLDSSNTVALGTKSSLDSSNTTALETRNLLDSSNSTANITKNNLDSSVLDGNILKTNLDSSISSGNIAKSDLDSSVNSATIINGTLDGTIETGNTSIDELNATNTAFQLIEPYNPSHPYIPLNKVTYLGSTYQCILASTGNLPTNSTYFILIAQAGSVTSVTSANTDISITTSTTTPVLTLNSGNSGANKILKLDSNGQTPAAVILNDSTHRFVADTDTANWNNLSVVAQAQAGIVQNSIYSGVTILPTITGSTTNLNGVTISAFEAFINGYKITVPQTVVTLPVSDISGYREDLVFLEAYFPTTNSYQMSYRLRTVANVNFNTYAEGINDTTNVKAWGGNSADTVLTYTKSATDSGLFLSGSGSAGDKTTLVSFDGYSYSIPLFKIPRRNSTIYSRLNPNGAKSYYSATKNIGTVTITLGTPSQLTVDSTANMNVGDTVFSSNATTVLYSIVSIDSATTFTVNLILATGTTGSITGSATIKPYISDRPDGLYANVIDARDIIPLRHKVSLTGNNYQQLMNDGIQKFMTGKLTTMAGKRMVKEYIGRFKQFGVTGVNKSDNTGLYGPQNCCVDSSGNIYIADQTNQRLVKLNSSMQYVSQFGVTGTQKTDNTGLNYPSGCTVDASGNVYIADTVNHRLVKLNSSLQYVSQFGITGISKTDNTGLNQPIGCAVDSSGNIYIADSNNYRLVKLDSTLQYVGQFGVTGTLKTDNTGLWNPRGCTVDSVGNIYITDTNNNRLVKLDSSLLYVTQFGVTNTPKSDNIGLSSPRGCAVDSAGNVYVADTSNHRLIKLNSSLSYVGQIGVTGVTKVDNIGVSAPYGCAIDSSGNLYITDTGNQRIIKITNPPDDLWMQWNEKYPSAIMGTQNMDGIQSIYGNSSMPQATTFERTVSQKKTGTQEQPWAANDTIEIKLLSGILTGVLDADTVYTNVTKSVTSTVIPVVSVTGLAVSDTVKIYYQATNTVSADLTISAVDSTNLTITVGSSVTVSPSDLIIENTSSTSVPVVKAFVDISGTATAGSSNTITLDVNASAIDSSYNGLNINITEGTGIGQSRTITSYVGSTKVLTVPAWTIAPDDTSVYQISGVITVTGTWTGLATNTAVFTVGALTGANGALGSAKLNVLSTVIYPQGQGLQYLPENSQVLSVEIGGVDTTWKQFGVTGTLKQDNTGLNGPYGCTVDSTGNVYIADSNNYRLVKLDSNLNYVSQFGVTGTYKTDNTGLYYPYGCAIDSLGNVYVADLSNHRLVKLNSSLQYIGQFGVTGISKTDNTGLNGPVDCSVDALNNIYVVDQSNHRLVKLNSSLQYVGQFGITGTYKSDNTGLRTPYGCKIDSTGNVYITDSSNHRLVKLNSLLQYVGQFGVTGILKTDNTGLNTPNNCTVDSTGNVYITDSSNHRLVKLNSSLQYVGQFGVTGILKTDNTGLYGPHGCTIDSTGNVYITNSNSRLIKISPSQTYMTDQYTREIKLLSPNPDIAVTYEYIPSQRLVPTGITSADYQVLAKPERMYFTCCGSGGKYAVVGEQVLNVYDRIYNSIVNQFGTNAVTAPYKLNPTDLKVLDARYKSGLIKAGWFDSSDGNITYEVYRDLNNLYLGSDGITLKQYLTSDLVLTNTVNGCSLLPVIVKYNNELILVITGQLSNLVTPIINPSAQNNNYFYIPLRLDGSILEK